MPTKTFPTAKAVAWRKGLALPEVDRLEMDHLLAALGLADKRLKDLEQAIARRSAATKDVAVRSSMPGVGRGFTALSLVCRVGRVERLPRAHRPANSWGLTPGCRDSGENDQRLGADHQGRPCHGEVAAGPARPQGAPAGRPAAGWFKRVKRRRGPTVGRVAVMRKLATANRHMLGKRQPYAECREHAAA